MSEAARKDNEVELLVEFDKRLRDLERRPSVRQRYPAEALEEVSTSSAAYIDLGGPEITVPTRPGAIVAVLCDVDMRNSASSLTNFAAELDGSGQLLAIGEDASNVYRRVLSGGRFPNGDLAVFPATANEHTLRLKYGIVAGGGTGVGFWRNRRLWAFTLS